MSLHATPYNSMLLHAPLPPSSYFILNVGVGAPLEEHARGLGDAIGCSKRQGRPSILRGGVNEGEGVGLSATDLNGTKWGEKHS